MDPIRVVLTPKQRTDAALAYRDRWVGFAKPSVWPMRSVVGKALMVLAAAWNLAFAFNLTAHATGNGPAVGPMFFAFAAIAAAAAASLGYLSWRGVVFPTMVPEVTLTPSTDGLLAETPKSSRFLPWPEIRGAARTREMLFIENGARVIAIPSVLDASGALWRLLEDRLTGKRLLVAGSDLRTTVPNTASGRAAR